MEKNNKKPEDRGNKNDFPGYPQYPSNEDIYNRQKEETELDPEDPTKQKTPPEKPDGFNEKSFRHDKTGGDLDIPGAELDDEQENIGSEDEENNLYSLGGDKE